MKNYIIIFSTLSCLSCVTQEAVLNSWLNSTKQEIIRSWGPPDRTSSDGGSGEILVYAKQIFIPERRFYSGGSSSVISPAETFWDYKYIYVDINKKIYYWRTQREKVPPMQIDLNVYKRY